MKTSEISTEIINNLKKNTYYLDILQSLHDVSKDEELDWFRSQICKFVPECPKTEIPNTFDRVASEKQKNFTHDYQYIESMHNFRTWAFVNEEHQQLANEYSGIEVTKPEDYDSNLFNQQQSFLHGSFDKLRLGLGEMIVSDQKLYKIALPVQQTYVMVMLREKTLYLQNAMRQLYQTSENLDKNVNNTYIKACELLDYATQYKTLFDMKDQLNEPLDLAIKSAEHIKRELSELHNELSSINKDFLKLTPYKSKEVPYEIWLTGKDRNLDKLDYHAYVKKLTKVTIKHTEIKKIENQWRHSFLAKSLSHSAPNERSNLIPTISKNNNNETTIELNKSEIKIGNY